MIRKAALALALVGAASLGTQAQAREVVDATGARVQLVDRPVRIITLAPSLGELAADLIGTEIDRIVAVSEYTDYPPNLRRLPTVGPYVRFNLEKVVSMKPDLVLATLDGNSRDQVLHLRELKIPVVVVGTESIEQVLVSVELVANAVGAPALGASMREQLKTGIERIRARGKNRPKPRVLLQIGEDPVIVVGRKSFLHESLEAVGAINIYGDSKDHYPRPALEDVIHRDPDQIIVLALGKDLRPFHEMAKRWGQYPQMRAVKNRKVSVLQGDAVLRPSLRLLEGLSLLEKAIHGSGR